MIKKLIKYFREKRQDRWISDRIGVLSEKKDAIKAKEILTESDRREIKIIDEEALRYLGVGKRWGRDLFIKCLVENLHFEHSYAPPKEGDLYCSSCDCNYVLKPDNVT